MERYRKYKMGDYIYNRLFCVPKNHYRKCVSGGGDDRISLPGVWTYEGICVLAAFGFFRGIKNTCIYLCSAFIFAGVFLEPLCKRTKSRKTLAGFGRGVDRLHDSILYLADDSLFSGRTSDELLLSKFMVYGENIDCRKWLMDKTQITWFV